MFDFAINFIGILLVLTITSVAWWTIFWWCEPTDTTFFKFLAFVAALSAIMAVVLSTIN